MLNNLKAEMARGGIKTSDIARVINKTDKCARMKVAGQTGFTFNECMTIHRTLFPDCSIEYLFAEEADYAKN